MMNKMLLIITQIFRWNRGLGKTETNKIILQYLAVVSQMKLEEGTLTCTHARAHARAHAHTQVRCLWRSKLWRHHPCSKPSVPAKKTTTQKMTTQRNDKLTKPSILLAHDA